MSGVAETTPSVLASEQPPAGKSLAVQQAGSVAPPISNTPVLLTEETLRERLAINSPELVEELFTLVQNLLTAETGRQTRLEAKATSLLTAAGLALTVVTGFATTVVAKDFVKHWPVWVFVVATTAFIIGVSSGLIGAILAVHALRVRSEYQGVNDESLFATQLLKDANAWGSPEEDSAEQRSFGLMVYRKRLIPHYWSILCAHRKIHDEKAAIVSKGQLFFLAFLASLLVVCALVAVGVVSS